YIDLVNEILEAYVATKGQLDPTVANDTGDSTAEELAANPHYVNSQAYGQLKQAVFPLTLPFNQPLEVVRAYLRHLGSRRYEMLQAFQKQLAAATPHALAAEYLRIAPEEYQILTGKKFDGTDVLQPPALREFYGYTEDQETRPIPDNPN